MKATKLNRFQVIIFLIVTCFSYLQSATITWNCTGLADSNWNTAINWSTASVPGGIDSVILDSSFSRVPCWLNIDDSIQYLQIRQCVLHLNSHALVSHALVVQKNVFVNDTGLFSVSGSIIRIYKNIKLLNKPYNLLNHAGNAPIELQCFGLIDTIDNIQFGGNIWNIVRQANGTGIVFATEQEISQFISGDSTSWLNGINGSASQYLGGGVFINNGLSFSGHGGNSTFNITMQVASNFQGGNYSSCNLSFIGNGVTDTNRLTTRDITACLSIQMWRQGTQWDILKTNGFNIKCNSIEIGNLSSFGAKTRLVLSGSTIIQTGNFIMDSTTATERTAVCDIDTNRKQIFISGNFSGFLNCSLSVPHTQWIFNRHSTSQSMTLKNMNTQNFHFIEKDDSGSLFTLTGNIMSDTIIDTMGNTNFSGDTVRASLFTIGANSKHGNGFAFHKGQGRIKTNYLNFFRGDSIFTDTSTIEVFHNFFIDSFVVPVVTSQRRSTVVFRDSITNDTSFFTNLSNRQFWNLVVSSKAARVKFTGDSLHGGHDFIDTAGYFDFQGKRLHAGHNIKFNLKNNESIVLTDTVSNDSTNLDTFLFKTNGLKSMSSCVIKPKGNFFADFDRDSVRSILTAHAGISGIIDTSDSIYILAWDSTQMAGSFTGFLTSYNSFHSQVPGKRFYINLLPINPKLRYVKLRDIYNFGSTKLYCIRSINQGNNVNILFKPFGLW